MRRQSRLAATFLLLNLICAQTIWAQAATGNIRGTVVDSSGGVIPNCPITITNQNTGDKRSLTTNDHGDFNAASIAVGTYTLTAEMAGFQKQELTGIVLQVDQTATYTMTLQPGTVSQTMRVEASAPLLETETSSVGQVIADKQILDMPLNGRNPFALGVLSGGTVQFTGLTTNLPIVAGGGRMSANDILLDGADDNLRNYNGSVGRAGITYIPSVDAVEEFKVKTSSFSAEYGHAAGYVMNATIKSGTNQFHGHAWEFLRNDKLDANNFVSNYAGRPKAAFRQNQFGATIGGPVRLPYYNGRDRTFFFVDYEGTQIRQAAGSTIVDLPPASFRDGNFASTSTRIYDPLTRRIGANGAIVDDPFPNNVIPTARIDPTVLKYQSLIPLPNLGTANAVSRNYFTPIQQQNKHNQGDARIDHHFSEKNSLTVRTSVSRQESPNAGTFLFSPQTQLFNTINAVIADTHVFTPTTLNEFRMGYNRANSSNFASNQDAGIAFANQNGFQSGPIIGFPNVNWTFSGQTLGTNEFTAFTSATTNYSFENAFQWTDNLTLIRGNHTVKTGIDVRRFRFDRLQGYPNSGNYFFGSTYTSNPSISGATGLPYADFLLGFPTSVISGNTSQVDWSMQRDLYVGPYIQDDWKVNGRLTLNLGFRYDLFTQPVQARDVGGMFDPYAYSSTGRRGIIITPGAPGYSRAIVEGHHKNFAPRFGFAYQASPKLVVRGGWGIFYSQREQNDQTTDFAVSLLNFRNINMPVANAQTSLRPLYSFTTPVQVNSVIDPQFSAFTAANPLSSNSGSFNAADITFSKFPMLQQFNLSIQYELVPNLLVEASYSGARGVHWVQRIDLNQVPFQSAVAGHNTQADRPFPFLQSSAGLDTADVSNWYNAFNFKVEHRFSHGFQVLANYTVSHATDSGNAGMSTFNNQGNTRAMNSYDLRLESGLSPLDLPQKFVVSANYQIPFGKGQRFSTSHGWVNQVVGGWEINGIGTLRSGLPTDVLTGSLPPVFATINRPDVVLGQPLLVPNPGFDQYFNPGAFSVPGTVRNVNGAPINTFGNASRMVLRGPGSKNLDFSLFKNFAVTERTQIQFRAEAFNLTNTPTFSLPSARSAALTVGNAAFGQLTSSQTVGRQVQFGLKLLW